MQNEPQLSAEMEKRLQEYFWHKLQWFLKNAEKGKDTIVRGKYSNDWHIMGTTSDILKEVATELATALEEQRKETARKVNALETLGDQRYMSESGFWSSRELVSRNDVRAILNGKETE